MSNDSTLIQHNLMGNSYGFSAASLNDLGSTEYTLVTIVVDESGSVFDFKDELEKCIQEIVKACKYSPRSDYLLLRIVAFNDVVREIHGFKQLTDCDLSDYTGCIRTQGSTALFDTVDNAIKATGDYGHQLFDAEFNVNAIVFILTDGMDNYSSPNVSGISIGKTLKNIIKEEYLESVITVLVGVGIGDVGIDRELKRFKDEASLSQFISISDANEKNLAKLADFISKSISSQSSSLGTGSASTPLNF